MSRATSWARKAVAAPTSSMLTRLLAGALAFALSSSLSNSGMPDAARVASGPGEMAWTRMPFGPSSADTYLHRAFQRGLGNAHDVVVLHDRSAAVIRHRKEGSAFLHQWLGQMSHPKERPARNLHGRQKSIQGHIDHSSVQRLLWCERNRMHDEVQLAPILGNSLEYGFHLPGHADIERHHDGSLKSTRQRIDMLLGLVV